MFEAYAQTPRPFTPAAPVRYGDRWYSVFTDAAGMLHFRGTVPWPTEDLAQRAGRLFCATVGANHTILLNYNYNGLGFGSTHAPRAA